MQDKKVWQVWVEEDNEQDTILFEGSETKARKFYKENKNKYNNIHIGYLIPEEGE